MQLKNTQVIQNTQTGVFFFCCSWSCFRPGPATSEAQHLWPAITFQHVRTGGNCNSHFSPLCLTAGGGNYTFRPNGLFFGSVVCPGRHPDTHILPQSDDTISPLMVVFSDSKGKMYKTPWRAFKGHMWHLFKVNLRQVMEGLHVNSRPDL